MNSIGERIAQLRNNNGFTQEILANTLGVSPRTVSKWETGTTMPDILLLPMIADVFGTTIDELLGIKSASEERKYSKNTFHEDLYKRFFYEMAGFWQDGSDKLPREERAEETCFVYPGAIQYFGPTEVCDATTVTLALEKGE